MSIRRKIRKEQKERKRREKEEEIKGYILTADTEEMREITKLYVETIYYRNKDLREDYLRVKGIEVNKEATIEELKEEYKKMKNQVSQDKRDEKRILEIIRRMIYKPNERKLFKPKERIKYKMKEGDKIIEE